MTAEPRNVVAAPVIGRTSPPPRLARRPRLLAAVVLVATALWCQACGDENGPSSSRPTATPAATPTPAVCGGVTCPVGKVCCNALNSACVAPGQFCAL